ncbi:MAG: putative toxin-antitoxin system toxin component, PIN family [Armatimonadetes bacterium]|nr:putative toxin-antitoxin system toxin component, PIN family [Armatimonadota bacterium]
MKVVLDTNVLISAFIYGGAPLRLVELAESGVLDVVTSEEAVSERQAVLSRGKFALRMAAMGLKASTILSRYREVTSVVEPGLREAMCTDPADDLFIAIAVAAGADAIVSGDSHLRSCSNRCPVPVMTVAECLSSLSSA